MGSLFKVNAYTSMFSIIFQREIISVTSYLLCFVFQPNNFVFYSCSVNELLKIKEELTKERDDQLGEIVKLREQLAQSAATMQHLEEQKQQCEEKIQEVSECLQNQNTCLNFPFNQIHKILPDKFTYRVAQSVAYLTHEPEVPGLIPGPATYFCFSFC